MARTATASSTPAVQDGDRKELYSGFSGALSRAFELAVTPMLFGGLGWLLDRWIGIAPVLTIAFAIFAITGTGVSAWYRYKAQMDEAEAGTPWAKARGRATTETDARRLGMGHTR
jgi:F0F1-type ATP synthase assembly protein I